MPWFDVAVRRPISVNHGGALAPNLGLVLHHQVGNGSLWAFFNNPASRVSTHFWVDRDGTIEQYIDTNLRCWGGMNLNASYVQIETTGCGPAPHAEPMTEAMVAALGRLYAEGMRRHGWPARHANANGQPGLGFHRMAGSGANTSCICDVRLAMRDEILRRAGGAPPPPPPPPATEEVKNLLLRDDQTGGFWAAYGTGAIHALRGAPFLGGTNNPKYNAQNFPVHGIVGNGAGGYVICLDFGTAHGGDRFRLYDFPRDGSAIVR